jgi:hypothetical protein
MGRSTRVALSSAVLLLVIRGALSSEDSATANQTASENKDASRSASSWTIGIAQFAMADKEQAPSVLLTTIPRLIISDLGSFPTRRVSTEDSEEIARIKSAKARFAAGNDLATKLDDRAQKFLDPAIADSEKRYNMRSAQKAVRESAEKMDDALGKEEKTTRKMVADSLGQELTVNLWDGHAKGKLIEPPGPDISKAAKAAGVDFLVFGTLSLVRSEYAAVSIRGYDAVLGREVLSFSSFCAVDDPTPLASEIAQKIERLCAGRDYVRIELVTNPASAEIYVNGQNIPGSARVAYIYEPGPVKILATAPGFESASTEFFVALGERRKAELNLEAEAAGNVALGTTPTGASLELDSMPIGISPASIPLDGSRKVLNISADGMEPQTVVLPASGESSLEIELQPSDGIGQSGRISAAKDDFYWSFGWFVLSLPITTLTLGIYNGYEEAYTRSESPYLAYSCTNASRALAAACTISATTAIFMVIRLVKYLKTAR